ncbi:MAG TPA: ABC transporter permease, partial [Phototrophicaceae bacterium]|nr:ABC transporter permease [Phototrophicaceae bacterium]
MLQQIFTASLFASAIRLATPYIFASLGEMFGQRSGVLNLGVDGIMLMGAFTSFYVVTLTDSLLLGIVVALLTGLVMGLVMAFISVTLHAEQGISGIGLYLFGLGMSELLFQKLIGTPRSVAGFPDLHFQILSDIQFLGIGEIFFRHNLLVYVAFALVPISAFILKRTPLGLMIRAAGQNPEAADAMGINVARVRYFTVCMGSMAAGLAGASLSIALLRVFQQNLTSGLGFIAVALVYFGRWQPYGVLAGALLFSFVN